MKVAEKAEGAVYVLLLLSAHRRRREQSQPEALAKLVMRRGQQIFDHRHPFQFSRNLEGACQATLRDAVNRQAGNGRAIKKHGTSIRSQKSCNEIGCGTLARTVWPDQPSDTPACDRKGTIINSPQATKGFDKALHFQNARCGVGNGALCLRFRCWGAERCFTRHGVPPHSQMSYVLKEGREQRQVEQDERCYWDWQWKLQTQAAGVSICADGVPQ